jgi:hypothetical protein
MIDFFAHSHSWMDNRATLRDAFEQASEAKSHRYIVLGANRTWHINDEQPRAGQSFESVSPAGFLRLHIWSASCSDWYVRWVGHLDEVLAPRERWT